MSDILSVSVISDLDTLTPGFSVTHQLGNWPVLTLAQAAQPAESGIVELMDAELFARFGEMQTAMFRPTLEFHGVRWTVGDVSGQFRGYLVQDTMNYAHGGVGMGGNLMGAVSAMSSMVTGIYRPVMSGTKFAFEQERSNLLEKLNMDSIAERLLGIMDLLDTAWSKDDTLTQRAAIAGSGERALLDKVHSNNSEPMAILRTILRESPDATLQGLSKINDARFHIRINMHIMNLHTQGAEGYLSNLQALCASFRLQYTPSIGTYGALVPVDTGHFQGDGEKLSLGIAGLTLSPGMSMRLAPRTHVAITGVPAPSFSRGRSSTQPAPVSVLVFPAGVDGLPWTEELPVWFDVNHLRAATYPDATGKSGMQLGQPKTLRKIEVKRVKEIYENLKSPSGPLRSYMRRLYIDRALGGSQVSLTVPFNEGDGLIVGKRYSVSSKKGDAFFNGTLASMVQSLQVHPEPSAGVRLTFSHVEAGGFKLPGV